MYKNGFVEGYDIDFYRLNNNNIFSNFDIFDVFTTNIYKKQEITNIIF